MKKITLFSIALVGIVFLSCNKTTTLPVAPTPAKNFSISKFVHQKDTIAVGDALSFNASGTITDTTKTLSVFLTATYGTVTYSIGAAATPVKVNRVIGANANGAYAWTAVIPTFSTSIIPHNTKVAVTATFTYQLSLSSAQPTVVYADQGLRPGDTKTNLTTVFIQ